MFPSRESSVRRRSKVYGNAKAARSSKLSLLSTFTITTSSSGGSNSTVTQDSYNRSQHKHRRRRQHRPRRPEPRNASVDVFDFLVEDDSQENSGAQDSEAEGEKSEEDDHASDPGEDMKLKAIEDGDPERFYRSMSDSGISMSSSERPTRGRYATIHERSISQPTPHFQSRELAVLDPRTTWPPYSPQPQTEQFIPPPCPPPPPAVRMEHMYPYSYTPYGTPPAEPEEVRRVPALLIREPVGHVVKPPCFRPFTKLSTRLLLQMQDEIADLEAELRLIDADTDRANVSNDESSAKLYETIGRQDRELDIYEELHVKLENYCTFTGCYVAYANRDRSCSRVDGKSRINF